MSLPMISIVIPAYNEERNVKLLYKELDLVSRKINKSFEFIFVDDGSEDETLSELRQIEKKDKRVKIIEFTKNFGQTAAFDAGIKLSKGNVIITMDADLQNDPRDIITMLPELKEEYDAVVGWREDRKDKTTKRLISYFANLLRRIFTGDKIHDSGCSLRVYKKEVLSNVDLYGEMHRFIPTILELKGYKIAEVKVNHRKRKYGKSKYGLSRLVKGLLDLLFIVFLLRFSSRPIHIFGSLGGITFLIGFILAIYLSFIKIFYGASLASRPLLILSVLLIVLGTQIIIFGILAEVLIRVYFRTHRMKPYNTRK